MDFERILVPMDFSSSAQEAFDAVLKHFPDSKLFLLHVIESTQNESFLEPSMKEEFHSKVQDATYKKLEALISDHKKDKGRIEPVVGVGKPAAIILESATEQKVDMIAMGSHGNDSISKYFFGSTTYAVSRKSDCSVWILKSKQR